VAMSLTAPRPDPKSPALASNSYSHFSSHANWESWWERRGGAVAQLGERRNRTAEVRGSNPLGSTKSPLSY
jgi:hypothetical protein